MEIMKYVMQMMLFFCFSILLNLFYGSSIIIALYGDLAGESLIVVKLQCSIEIKQIAMPHSFRSKRLGQIRDNGSCVVELRVIAVLPTFTISLQFAFDGN